MFGGGCSFFGYNLTFGHSHKICQSRSLLVQIWRGESHFSQKRLLVNLENLESGIIWHLANLANLVIFRLGHFMYKKRYFYLCNNPLHPQQICKNCQIQQICLILAKLALPELKKSGKYSHLLYFPRVA